jgi:hypothetical protein
LSIFYLMLTSISTMMLPLYSFRRTTPDAGDVALRFCHERLQRLALW